MRRGRERESEEVNDDDRCMSGCMSAVDPIFHSADHLHRRYRCCPFLFKQRRPLACSCLFSPLIHIDIQIPYISETTSTVGQQRGCCLLLLLSFLLCFSLSVCMCDVLLRSIVDSCFPCPPDRGQVDAPLRIRRLQTQLCTDDSTVFLFPTYSFRFFSSKFFLLSFSGLLHRFFIIPLPTVTSTLFAFTHFSSFPHFPLPPIHSLISHPGTVHTPPSSLSLLSL